MTGKNPVAYSDYEWSVACTYTKVQNMKLVALKTNDEFTILKNSDDSSAAAAAT